MATLVLTYVGLAGTFTASFDDTNITGSGTWHDGSHWITTGSSVSMLGHTPARVGIGNNCRNGSQLNVRGNMPWQGMDGRDLFGSVVSSYQNTTFTADEPSNVFTANTHLMSNGQAVQVRNVGGALPTGLSASTPYWIVNRAANTFQLSATRGGAAINITTAGTGTQYVEMTVAYPIPLIAGDVVVIARSGPGGQQQQRPLYYPRTGSANIEETMTVHVLAVAPTADNFKPNTVGDPAARQSVLISSIQWPLIPQVFSQRPSSVTFGEMEALFARNPGEYSSSWQRHFITPLLQNPGYGGDFASACSQAACKLLERGYTQAQRQTLMVKFVQWGIESWGAHRDGRIGYDEGGGHCQGHKGLIIFAGVALGDANMADPNTFLGSSTIFKEDAQYYTDGTDMWHGSPWKWCFAAAGAPFNPRSYQNAAPSTWTVGTFHSSPLFSEVYRSYLTTANQVGMCAVMLALRKQTQWGKPAVGWITWFMEQLSGNILADVKVAPGNPAGVTPTGYDDQGQTNAGFKSNYCQEVYWEHRWTDACMVPRWTSAPGFSMNFAALMNDAQEFRLFCHDVPAWGATVQFEALNCPIASSTELRMGSLRTTPVIEGQNATIWVDSGTATTIAISNANTWGFIKRSQALPATPGGTAQEIQFAIQIVFTMPGGTKFATNAIVCSLAP